MRNLPLRYVIRRTHARVHRTFLPKSTRPFKILPSRPRLPAASLELPSNWRLSYLWRLSIKSRPIASTLRGEDPAALEALTAEYIERFHPCSPERRHYVDTLIRDDWQLRRLAKADAQIWEYEMQCVGRFNESCPLGQAFCRGVFVAFRRARFKNWLRSSNPVGQRLTDAATRFRQAWFHRPAPSQPRPNHRSLNWANIRITRALGATAQKPDVFQLSFGHRSARICAREFRRHRRLAHHHRRIDVLRPGRRVEYYDRRQ